MKNKKFLLTTLMMVFVVASHLACDDSREPDTSGDKGSDQPSNSSDSPSSEMKERFSEFSENGFGLTVQRHREVVTKTNSDFELQRKSPFLTQRWTSSSNQPSVPDVLADSRDYSPAAEGTFAPATALHMLSPHCSFSHVMLAVGLPVGPYTIGKVDQNPERPRDNRPDGLKCAVYLTPEWLAELRKKGEMRLPVLTRVQGEGRGMTAYLPEEVCMADVDGSCVKKIDGFEIVDYDRLFNRLKMRADAFETAFESGASLAIIYGEYKRYAAPRMSSDSASTPGQNAALQRFVDKSLLAYQADSSVDKKNMYDFFERIQLADADMIALAGAQSFRFGPFHIRVRKSNGYSKRI